MKKLLFSILFIVLFSNQSNAMFSALARRVAVGACRNTAILKTPIVQSAKSSAYPTIRYGCNTSIIRNSAAKKIELPIITRSFASSSFGSSMAAGNQAVIIGAIGASLSTIALANNEPTPINEEEKQNAAAEELYYILLLRNNKPESQNEKIQLINSASEEVLKKCIEKIAKNIDKFICDHDTILLIIKRSKEAAKEFTKSIAENFDQVMFSKYYYFYNLKAIIENDSQAAKIFAQKVAKNLDKISPNLIEIIVENDKEIAKIFTKQIMKNFKDINYIAIDIVKIIIENDKEAAEKFAPLIAKNFDKINPSILEVVIKNSKEAIKVLTPLASKHFHDINDPITKIFISYSPEIFKMFQKNFPTGVNIPEDTQTGGHAKNKWGEILSYLQDKRELIPFINQVTTHEKELNDGGRYVLYHGMSKEIDFISQVYTRLWEAVHKEKLIDGFRFLRFFDSNDKVINFNSKIKEEPCSESNRENFREEILKEVRDESGTKYRYNRLLFANGYLFGNLDNKGECTIDYVTKDRSIRCVDIPLKELFDCFNISNEIYNKYKDRLENLRELNEKIGEGRLLQIGLTEDQLHACTYTAESGGPSRDINIQGLGKVDSNKNGALILETVKRAPEAIEEEEDWIYCAILTSDIILNKDSGIKMRFYHTGDENEWQSYVKQRDELFEEIARDIKEEEEKKNENTSILVAAADRFKENIKIFGLVE